MVLVFKYTDIEDKLPPSDGRTVLVDFFFFFSWLHGSCLSYNDWKDNDYMTTELVLLNYKLFCCCLFSHFGSEIFRLLNKKQPAISVLRKITEMWELVIVKRKRCCYSFYISKCLATGY